MDFSKTFEFRLIYGLLRYKDRWLQIDWPWSTDHRYYGCPLSINWHGKKLCWGWRPFDNYQKYNWKHGHYGKERAHLVFYPADTKTRMDSRTCPLDCPEFPAGVKPSKWIENNPGS
jgi:hypothetical protein